MRNKVLLDEILAKNAIAIFGAGNLGKKVMGFLKAKNANIVCVGDNNEKKWGTTIDNIPVQSVGDCIKNNPNAVWIVAVWSPNCSFVQIKKQLQFYGTNAVYHSAALMQAYHKDLLPHYHFETAAYYESNIDTINKVLSILNDEESKIQYRKHMECRINLDFDNLPVADVNNQYFPADLIDLNQSEYFLDAGAYNGDTLLDFYKRVKGKYINYIALEPDPTNFNDLNTLIKINNINNVTTFAYAISNKNCILNFEATGGAGAVFSNNGTIEVASIRVDDIFGDIPFTFIKMDIEGAELDALKGAKNTIEKYKPTLAICIYHKPDDIWEIPLYIKEQFPYYKLYVRTHQFDGLDFVLYAIPS